MVTVIQFFSKRLRLRLRQRQRFIVTVFKNTNLFESSPRLLRDDELLGGRISDDADPFKFCNNFRSSSCFLRFSSASNFLRSKASASRCFLVLNTG